MLVGLVDLAVVGELGRVDVVELSVGLIDEIEVDWLLFLHSFYKRFNKNIYIQSKKSRNR